MSMVYSKVLSIARGRKCNQTHKKINKLLGHVEETFETDLASGFDLGFQIEFHRTWSLCSWHSSCPCWLQALCNLSTGAWENDPAVPITCHTRTGLWLGQTVPETVTVTKEKQGSDCSDPSYLPTSGLIKCHPYPKHWAKPEEGHAFPQTIRGTVTENHTEDEKRVGFYLTFFFSVSTGCHFRFCISFVITSLSGMISTEWFNVLRVKGTCKWG